MTIEIRRIDLIWPATELPHAITKRGSRNADIFVLCGRLDYALETGNGSLDSWH